MAIRVKLCFHILKPGQLYLVNNLPLLRDTTLGGVYLVSNVSLPANHNFVNELCSSSRKSSSCQIGPCTKSGKAGISHFR